MTPRNKGKQDESKTYTYPWYASKTFFSIYTAVLHWFFYTRKLCQVVFLKFLTMCTKLLKYKNIPSYFQSSIISFVPPHNCPCWLKTFIAFLSVNIHICTKSIFREKLLNSNTAQENKGSMLYVWVFYIQQLLIWLALLLKQTHTHTKSV